MCKMENKIITLFKKVLIDEEDLRKFHKKENEIITRAIGIVLESRGYVFDNSDDLNTFISNEMCFLKRATKGYPINYELYANLKNGENIAVFDVRTKITDSNIEKIIKIKTLKLLNN